MDGIRDNQSHKGILQISHLCKSVGGADIKMLTITENILSSFTYYDMLSIFAKKDLRDRHNIKQMVDKMSNQDLLVKV